MPPPDGSIPQLQRQAKKCSPLIANFRLILVRSMSERIFFPFLSVIISFTIASSAIASGAVPGSASLVYQSRANNIFVQSVIPELAKSLDQLIAAGGTKV